MCRRKTRSCVGAKPGQWRGARRHGARSPDDRHGAAILSNAVVPSLDETGKPLSDHDAALVALQN
jgi:hypothetical protein